MDHSFSFTLLAAWADQKHDICLRISGSPNVEGAVVELDDLTTFTNRLTMLLKGCFPEAIGRTGDLGAPLSWVSLAQFPRLESAQQASCLEVRQLYRAHTHHTPEHLEGLSEQIRTARQLTTDDAFIHSSVLMIEILAEQLRVVGASGEIAGSPRSHL